MAALLVRNLDDRLVQKLKQRAKRNGRSVEAEHRALLEQSLGPADKAEWLARAAELRQGMIPVPDGTSLELLRESRDER